MRRSAAAAALALAFLFAPLGAAAQPYDPAHRWRTIETEHFRVHFHEGEDELAQTVARVAERAHATLAPVLGHAPRRTEIVLSDDTDDANGLATPVPYNTMRLYAVPPVSFSELADHRSWLETLVFHEYVHILHLDQVSGLPGFGNRIFGKLFVPNGFVPGWMVEGLAVLHEADGDPGAGRNATALHDMYARTLALTGFPRLADVSNPLLEWPLGHAPYLLGGRFYEHLQAGYGQDAVRTFIVRQGAQIWPYAPSWSGKRAFGGRSFEELWDEYAVAERERAEEVREVVRAEPVTVARRLTFAGGRAENPRWSPDGSYVAYVRRGLDERPAIRRVSPDGRDLGELEPVDSNGTFDLASPREALAAIGEVHRELRLHDDLYRLKAGGGRERLTRGERATDPDVAPDGSFVAYVRRTGPGAVALVRRPIDARGRLGEREVLFERPDAEVFSPRLAPDSRRIAFELHEGGRRDVVVLEDGRLSRITDDDALDTAPAWTPDGRFLLFASDRGGVHNVHAWDAETGAIRRVTNVETGAFQPDVSPDGRTIAFLSYTRDGFDVSTMPFDPGGWLEPWSAEPAPGTTGTTSSTATATATSTSTATSPATPVTPPTDVPLPSRPYRALDTLAPTFWLPLWTLDGAGSAFGLLTGGTDVLLRHAWLAQPWWSVGTNEPGYALSYAGTWSWPRLDLSSTRFAASSPDPVGRLVSAWTLANVGATFTWTRVARSLALRVGWSGTLYDTYPGEPPPDLLPEPFQFRDGFLSDVSARATYADSRRFVRSISPEEGRELSVTLRFAGRETGSDYDLARARASVAQYLRLPFTRHGVLALRLGAGIARGTLGGSEPFSLGGVSQPDLLSLLLGGGGSPADALRGYSTGYLDGTGFVLGNAELRFPLAAPLFGRNTWPLFLRRVHGAVFVDVGDAFDRPGEPPFAGHRLSAEELRVGAGAELRLELVLGYRIRTDVRVGVARAFGAVLGDGRAADLRRTGEEPPEIYPYVVLGGAF